MTTYRVTPASAKIFTLYHNDKILGSLTYEKWFSSRAAIDIPNHPAVAVEPKGLWETNIEIRQGDTVLFDLKMEWNGQFVINQRDDTAGPSFRFKQKSLMKSTFVLLGPADEELLLIEPSVKWNQLSNHFQLNSSEAFEHMANKELLLLLSTHCANYYITTIMAATVITAS